VLFTGSTEVAQAISRSLAGRAGVHSEPCLIAETGGQNAMVVDSSALAEQVVQDARASAFDSAGQRCSALRVLCLQDDIADRLLAMLRAALAELRVGDPGELSTDLGPVIDAQARDVLEAHVAAMRSRGRPVTRIAPPADLPAGTFVMPTLIEIERMDELEREVFGPILHVLRFSGERLDELAHAINATGYGLTFGAHSRIDETIARLTGAVRAGNIYINRNMIGAAVGVQPFGGEGRSGTGPKAGGPTYLPRLMRLAPPDPALLGLAAGDALPAPFAALRAWAAREGRGELVRCCDAYAAATPLGHRAVLQGPTGEENTLSFVPRGRVFCRADDEDERLHQVAAALATGNVAVLPAGCLPVTLLAEKAITAALATVDPATDPAADAILAAIGDEALAGLRRRVAMADGPLVAVIAPDPAGGAYRLYRLVCERVISANTAAAGGNTTLMTLAS
jgi:RHH-type transcriptional regulator, proline utilization regulon repressor / proline dehydrogenase / delta 1-pyrroline-5-carboxylate dehydrogenase